MSRIAARRAVACLVVAGTALGAVSCGRQAAPAAGPPTIEVAENACGTGWHDPHPGEQTLVFRNTGSQPTTADLVDITTGAIYAEVNNLASNTTRSIRVRLGGGRFAVRCAMENSDNAIITGPVVTLAGPPAGPAVLPVTAADLYDPDRRYTDYVTAGLARLATDTDTLRADLTTGDRTAARTAWLTAHLDYGRLGAAYGAFGDFDTKLDGRADGLPGGVADPDFTGFHRVEYGLWHNESAMTLAAAVDRLADNVHALVAAFPAIQVPIEDLGLRTHEILENTLQFELTAATDYGSGTTLATAAANTDGTRELLTVLQPILQSRYPQLPQVGTWLDRFQAQLNSHHTAGAWTPVAQLGPADHQRLDGTLGQLLEYLAPIAVICKPRKTFQ
ncbi:EfeM/EfeO family lipoprotein [Nocardia terpenica]|uniref:EfeM/EfeO family lipoprotein n=1 Tax=Nocardia terpenica TaxID=455432 RepID=A0A291RKX3_9NOCA|nr:EfeM/EfeO family lipoprotein [Nocardia terpenica]ATL67940.1 EfeM/EfeO family lipoprotein [Nocardia terpenica]